MSELTQGQRALGSQALVTGDKEMLHKLCRLATGHQSNLAICRGQQMCFKRQKKSVSPVTFARDLACLGASPVKLQDRDWDALPSPSWSKYYLHGSSEELCQVCCLSSLLTWLIP